MVGDLLDEPNETFAVVLSNSTGPTISDSRGDGTITDDDMLTIDVADVVGGGGRLRHDARRRSR